MKNINIILISTALLISVSLSSCTSEKVEIDSMALKIPETEEKLITDDETQIPEAPDYVWLSVSDAEELAEKKWEKFIRNIVDWEDYYALTDFEAGRIRATIEDGIIVSYYIEWGSVEPQSTSQLIETVEETGPEVILSGNFTGDTSWSIEIVREWDENTLVFSGFSTGSAPDLHVYVSETSISSESDISWATEISRLEKRTGDQAYLLPATIDADNISSIAIHCKSYDKLYGTAQVQ